jgi:glycosyltransferase involved in cell wall biosynthesis
MIVAYNALSVRPDVADGASTFTLNVLRHLPHELGKDRLIVFARAAEDRIPAAANLEVLQFGSTRGPLSRIALETLGLGRQIGRRGVDVLISPNESLPRGAACPTVVVAQNLVYHCGLVPGAFAGRTLRQQLETRAQAAYWRRRMRAAYATASRVVCVSEETLRVLAARAGLEPSKTMVAHEGGDSFLLPAPGAPGSRENRVLVVSALAPYKGLEETLALFARLREARPALRLEIVGEDWRGYAVVVRRRIAELSLEEHVLVRGGVGADELASLYRTSLVLLLLSRCESFGLPVVEAMRYGLPVVAARRSSLPEVAGGAALLVEPDDIETATGAVRALLGDAVGLARLSELGRARASQLTWRATAAAIAEQARRAVSG